MKPKAKQLIVQTIIHQFNADADLDDESGQIILNLENPPRTQHLRIMVCIQLTPNAEETIDIVLERSINTDNVELHRLLELNNDSRYKQFAAVLLYYTHNVYNIFVSEHIFLFDVLHSYPIGVHGVTLNELEDGTPEFSLKIQPVGTEVPDLTKTQNEFLELLLDATFEIRQDTSAFYDGVVSIDKRD